MTELSFVSKMMRERIAPPGSAEDKSSRIRLAAQKLKWKFSRAYSAWYADPRVSIKPAELRQIEEKAGEKFASKHPDLEEVDALIERGRALVNSRDPRVRRAFAVAMRAFASTLLGARTSRNR